VEPVNESRRLEGVPNFRDLGGLSTADGGRTRRGVVFRSSGLEELTAADLRYLVDDLGLRTVFDLRSPDDIETVEPLVDAGVRVVNYPIVRPGSSTSLRRPMRTDGRVDVPRVYRMFLDSSATSIASIFTDLVNDATPALFHCAAGKDRTGVLAALLLGAVGVTRDEIVDDFMASAPVLDEITAYLQRRPAYADVVLHFPPGTMDAEPAFIEDFLDAIESEHGSIGTWLIDQGGVSSATIEQWRRKFVEDTAPDG
jgi:protein tyrosine/serine phosphatase